METPGTATPHDLYLNPGDADALHRLYEQFAPMVYSACLRRLSGRSDWADDATQGVFVLLMRQPRQFPCEQALAAWLHRAAYYACLHITRDEKRRREREQRAMNISARETSEPSEAAVAESWTAISPHLDEALEGLSSSQRAAVLSHFFIGQSLSQIARDTGRSKVAIHGLVQRALENLRRSLVRKGVAVPSVALASLLSAHAAEAAPPIQSGVALMQAIANGTSKAAVTAAATGAQGMFVAAKIKAVAIAATLVLGSATLVTGTVIFANRSETHAVAATPTIGRVLLVDQRDPRANDSNSGTSDAPIRTVSAAVAKLKPGDSVVIKAGVYRESVAIAVSGTPTAPIRLAAAPGERVVISGADPINGWKPCTTNELAAHPHLDHLRWVDLTWMPHGLSCAGGTISLRPSQWSRPNAGPIGDDVSLTVTGSDRAALVDSQYLDQSAGSWVGGRILIRRDIRKDDRLVTSNHQQAAIVSYDQQRHELQLQERMRSDVTLAADATQGETVELWYQISNLPALINGPGQFAISKTATGFRCYVWPPEGIDLDKSNIEGVRRIKGLSARDVSNLTIDGLEIAQIADSGITLEQGNDNAVVNCVVHDCQHYSYSSVASGMYLRNQRNSRIERCLSLLNGQGIAIESSADITIQHNAIGRSVSHGISLSRTVKAPIVLRNYVFDCWNLAGSNADGVQTMLNVTSMRLERNLFLNVGVGWQSSETQGSLVKNNVWAGIHTGGAINCGWNRGLSRGLIPNRGNSLTNNTILAGLVSIGQDGAAYGNLLLSTPNVFGVGPQDANLHWSPHQSSLFKYWAQGEQRTVRTFAEWQRAVSPSAQQSRFAQARFRSGPAFEVATVGNGTDGDPRLAVEGDASGFEIGDIVELNCDGVPRRVTAIERNLLAIEPTPPPEWVSNDNTVIWNWKDNTRLVLDLRLAEGSPGKGLTTDGGDVGATLDLQAYMRGDFDDDGKRDIPALPPELRDQRTYGIRLSRFLN